MHTSLPKACTHLLIKGRLNVCQGVRLPPALAACQVRVLVVALAIGRFQRRPHKGVAVLKGTTIKLCVCLSTESRARRLLWRGRQAITPRLLLLLLLLLLCLNVRLLHRLLRPGNHLLRTRPLLLRQLRGPALLGQLPPLLPPLPLLQLLPRALQLLHELQLLLQLHRLRRRRGVLALPSSLPGPRSGSPNKLPLLSGRPHARRATQTIPEPLRCATQLATRLQGCATQLATRLQGCVIHTAAGLQGPPPLPRWLPRCAAHVVTRLYRHAAHVIAWLLRGLAHQPGHGGMRSPHAAAITAPPRGLAATAAVRPLLFLGRAVLERDRLHAGSPRGGCVPGAAGKMVGACKGCSVVCGRCSHAASFVGATHTLRCF